MRTNSCKVKVVKTHSLNPSPVIEDGYIVIGTAVEDITIGRSWRVLRGSSSLHGIKESRTGIFCTSVVAAVIPIENDLSLMKTQNSEYIVRIVEKSLGK